MTSDTIPEWTNASIVNGAYDQRSGGWEELFDYSNIRDPLAQQGRKRSPGQDPHLACPRM